MSMKFAWFRGVSSQAEISMASCSEPSCLLEKKSQLRYHSIFNARVTREGLLAILAISEEEIYILTPVVVAEMLAAAVVAAAVGAAAVVVRLRLVAGT